MMTVGVEDESHAQAHKETDSTEETEEESECQHLCHMLNVSFVMLALPSDDAQLWPKYVTALLNTKLLCLMDSDTYYFF
jgi:hypothetical protein